MPSRFLALNYHDEATLKCQLNAMFQDIFTDITTIPYYFSPGYIHTVNGITLKYHEFIQYVENIIQNVKSIKAEVMDASLHHGLLATRHLISITHHDGSISEQEIYLFGRVENGQLVSVNEAIQILKGDPIAVLTAHILLA